MSWCLRRPSPDPGLGAQVELSGGDAGSLFDFLGIGKTLSCQRIAAKKSPPAFLHIEPTCPCGNEDLMDARRLLQPSARLEAVMTAEIISDDEDVACGIVGFDGGSQSPRIAQRGC